MIVTIIFAIATTIRPNNREALLAAMAQDMPALVGIAGARDNTQGIVTADADRLGEVMDILDRYSEGGNILLTATRLGEDGRFCPVVAV